MNILTLEQVLTLHAYVISQTGGSHGLRDLGRLEAVIAAQTQHVFGEEVYPGRYLKAAAILRGVIADHPFVDGNKRTAALSGLTFLKINRVKFLAERGELEDFAVKIATDHLAVAEIAEW